MIDAAAPSRSKVRQFFEGIGEFAMIAISFSPCMRAVLVSGLSYPRFKKIVFVAN
jgi:hypothetical protein